MELVFSVIDLDAKCHRCCILIESDVDELISIFDGVETTSVRIHRLYRLGHITCISFKLVDFEVAFEDSATLNNQMLVRKEADILELTEVVEGNFDVGCLHSLREVEVIVVVSSLVDGCIKIIFFFFIVLYCFIFFFLFFLFFIRKW